MNARHAPSLNLPAVERSEDGHVRPDTMLSWEVKHHEVDHKCHRTCADGSTFSGVGANDQTGRFHCSERAELRCRNSGSTGKQERSFCQTRRDRWLQLDNEPGEPDDPDAGPVKYQGTAGQQERPACQEALARMRAERSGCRKQIETRAERPRDGECGQPWATRSAITAFASEITCLGYSAM